MQYKIHRLLLCCTEKCGRLVSSLLKIQKSYLAKLLDKSCKIKEKDNVELFGLRIGNHTMQEAVDWVTTVNDITKSGVFVNVNSINLAFKIPSLKDCINQSDYVFADGSGVRMGAKYRGVQLKDNVNGTDLLPPLCTAMAQKKLSLFLLGGNPDVAKKTASNLLEMYPTLCIAGTHHGYFSKSGEETQRVINKINSASVDILLVGFGSPEQEKWLVDNKSALNVSTILAVGGLFDFFSGALPRAPIWMREHGVEWVWRLIQEPKAKFKRYVVGNPLFILRLLLSREKQHDVIKDNSETPICNGLSFYLQRFLATIGLLCISPILLVCALAVRLTSWGPVFYSQVRVGQYGKRFTFYKFRSMYLPNDPKYKEPKSANNREGVCKKYFNDSRVTTVGKFLRKYSIDELPQLLNVIKGDMLLIGPRPALVGEVESYRLEMYHRFDVMSGLTGLWQVSGRADTTFAEQIELDFQYVDQRSWWIDIKILFSTIPAVLTAKGAY